ncbi:MAG: histidine kinase [Pseudomonadota bacterium]
MATPKPKSNNQFYLPDLCAPRMVLVIVLVAELIALVHTLSRHSVAQDFWIDLAKSSLFLLWSALGGAWLLCNLRGWLAKRSVRDGTLLSLLLILLTVTVVSEAAVWLGQYTGDTDLFPTNHLDFLLRNLSIGLIVGVLLLRYFYVSHEWERNVRMEAQSRIQALQARIRPHFLFNSLNTIASLIRSNPETAEEAVEDMSDLFRANLREQRDRISVKEELEVARIYQRIEQLRLGDRLKVMWDVNDIPMRAKIPSLTIQPLLENAIYHGIEPLSEGGTVTITGKMVNDDISIRVVNPIPNATDYTRHKGNQMAMDNIRQRMNIAYGERAKVTVEHTDSEYSVAILFPREGDQ